MQVLAHPMHSSTSNQALSWLFQGGVLLLALLLVVGGLYLLTAPQTAFAQGATEILTINAALKVVFTGASTDDPGDSADPGQSLDTGRCQARLENRGRQSVRLEMLEFAASPGLYIQGPGYHVAPALRAREALETGIIKEVTSASTSAPGCPGGGGSPGCPAAPPARRRT